MKIIDFYIARVFGMGIGARVEPNKDEKNTDLEIIQYDVISPKYSLSDLIVPASTDEKIADFLAYKRHEQLIFKDWGLEQTHRHQKQIAINFYGASGTGKTMAAHAIAKELQQPLIRVEYASLESKYVGETSKNITKVFKQAKEKQAILFFDEADAILSHRVADMSHATDVSVNQTRSVLLSLMNDHQGLIIFTTNFIENYDSAFMRRILFHIHFELPDVICREKLWGKYIPSTLPHNVNLKKLAEISGTLSGSDISNCVLKAAMSAARQGCHNLQLEHFMQAVNEVLQSKAANIKSKIKIEKHLVSDDYVKSQIGGESMQEISS